MTLKELLIFAMLCGAMLALLQGCAPALPGNFCAIYQPVYTSDKDTAETRDAADLNNAVWLETCQ